MRNDGDRSNPWSMLLGFMVLTFVSLLVLIGGDNEERWLGMSGLVLFGLGGLAYLWRLRRQSQAVPPLTHTARIGDQEVVFPVNRPRMGFFAVAAALLIPASMVPLRLVAMDVGVSVGLWSSSAAASQGSVWIGWLLSGMVFGPLLAVGVVGLLRGGGLTLTPERLTYRSSPVRVSVRWDDIEDASAVNRRGQPMLDLLLTDTAFWQLGPFQRMYSRLTQRMYSRSHGHSIRMDVSIPLQTLRSKPAVVAGAVTHLQANPHDRSDPPAVVTDNGNAFGDFRHPGE